MTRKRPWKDRPAGLHSGLWKCPLPRGPFPSEACLRCAVQPHSITRPDPATLLSVVNPSFVQAAGRTVMSHSGEDKLLSGHARLQNVVPDRGSASRRKVNPEGRQLGD